MLVWGVIRRQATWFRDVFGEYSYERETAKWYQYIAVQVFRHLFGSPNSRKADPASEMEEITAIFWALVFLLIGLSFQLVGIVFSG